MLNSAPTANEELLHRLYDPAYVRRVELPKAGGPVQVCLDARMLYAQAGTGVATYASILAACLPGTGAAPALLDDEGEGGAAPTRLGRWLGALSPRARRAAPDGAGHGPSQSQISLVAPDLFRSAQVFFNLHGRLMPIACEAPPQVMHWTYPLPLYVQGARNIYTVHDLIPLRHPQLTGISRTRHRRLLDAILEHAHGLVTVSETVRQDVISEFGRHPDFVVNTYQAAYAPLQRDPPLPAGLRSGRYFLFFGTVERRKNLQALIAAHHLAGAGAPLVVAGPSAPGSEDLERLIAARPDVIRLPWQPRPSLIGLVRRARAVVFPSLAEGFGLPIVEAMTLGAPVMTSDRGACAEIAGGAALLVDPSDRRAMAAALARLAQDDRLCAGLRAAGFERARLFTPEAYQRRLQALYAGVLADRVAPLEAAAS